MPRRKTTAEFVEELRTLTNGEYVVFGEYVNSIVKLKFRHNKCGNEFWTSPHTLLTCYTRHKGGCLKCGLERTKLARRRCPDDFERQFKHNLGEEYELLDRYVNNRTKVSVRHTVCGNIFRATPNNLFDKGSRCGFCMRNSKGEFAIRSYLTDCGVHFSEQYRNDLCRNANTLPFDFAIFTPGGELAFFS